ncbi:hypothetical protein D3C84_1127800 [compost metagenome]
MPGHQLDATGQVLVGAHQGQHARDVGRVVLAVAVQGRQPASLGSLGGMPQRGALAQRAVVAQDAQLRVTLAFQLQQYAQGAVATAVIDHQHFVVFGGQRGANFHQQ